MDLEILREEHSRLINEINYTADTLGHLPVENQEHAQLRREFKNQISRAIELESQLLDLARLNFLQAANTINLSGA